MTTAHALLEVQDLDLAADALRTKRAELPARLAQRRAQEAHDALDRAIAESTARRQGLHARELELAEAVGAAAARAKELESQLYSGEVTAVKDLEALQKELELQRAQQGEVEESELEVLEQIEATDGEIAAQRGELQALAQRVCELGEDIRSAEAEIDAELAGLSERRVPQVAQVDSGMLEVYELRRTKPSLRGRGAALLGEGSCTGCRVTLPIMDYNRIKHAPIEVIECCPSCSRVLVR